MAPLTWNILTPEYPPQHGGVGDYARQLARALVRAGDRATVWAPACARAELPADGVEVQRRADLFHRSGLASLGAELAQRPGILLVQYVPSGFGYRAMNTPFARWLEAWPGRLWLMFHEVAYPVGWRVPPAQSVRGVVNRWMARRALRRCERAFVSTTAWAGQVEALWKGKGRAVDLPVPSNLPEDAEPAAVMDARSRHRGDADVLLGSFGTYGPLVAPLLDRALRELLELGPRRRALLIGRGSERFARRFGEVAPELAKRVIATGDLAPEAAAAHLAACHVLLQPFPDGVTTRRTSLMAGLALGKPVVTNAGALTETVWRERGGVALAPSPKELVPIAEVLLCQPERWSELGERGRTLYRERFSLQRAVETLRLAGAAEPAVSASRPAR
ncbi:MAG TPA: glycosyltransferase [Myxococcaceae bacterium]